MSALINSFLRTPHADNAVLWGLLYFVHLEDQNLKNINPDTPINAVEEYILTLAAATLEIILCVNIPDSFLKKDASITFRELAEMISRLPRLDAVTFQKHLGEAYLALSGGTQMN